jgi:MFS family permease
MADDKSEALCARGVKIMSLAFFGLFAGFGATQSLQSSENAQLGNINLASLYFAFVVMGLLCPPAVSKVVKSCGWRPLLVVAGCTYVVMIVSNLDTGDSKWYIMPAANALLGTGGAFIWTTQNFYFGQCAYHAGKDATGGASEMATKFNSMFFSIFQFSNMTGCLVSSVILLAFGTIAWVKTLLFFVLGAAAAGGVVLFLIVPNVDPNRTGGEADESPSPTAALRVLGNPKLTLMLPWIITQGMTFAFVNSDFMSDTVTPLLGDSYVGIIMTIFYVSDCLFTIGWGRLLEKRTLNRQIVFFITFLLWCSFFVLKLLWTRPAKWEKDDAGKWQRKSGTEFVWLDAALPVVLAVIGGAADGFWNPGQPAILQSFFADTPDLLAVMAAYKALQSLGFAVQFTIAASLKDYPAVRGLILLGCCVFAAMSLFCLDRFKHPLDPRSSQLIQPLDNAGSKSDA